MVLLHTVPKLTFSVDHSTVERLRKVSARLRMPQSQIVREAVAEYAARADRLSDAERARMLGILDDVIGAPRASGAAGAQGMRRAADVDAEIDGIRRSRRLAGARRAKRT